MMNPFGGKVDRGFYRRIDRRYLFDRLPERFLPKEGLPPVVRNACDAIILIHSRDILLTAYGTGICLAARSGIDGGAVVVTALHVVKSTGGTDFIRVGDRNYIGVEVARDESCDLVLLESNMPITAPDVEFAKEDELGHGELYIVGHLYVRKSRKGKITTYEKRLCAYNIASSARRQLLPDGKFAVSVPSEILDFFNGFSGGPLMDSRGVIIGMVQQIRYGRIFVIIPLGHSSVEGVHGCKLQHFINSNNGQV